MGLEIERKFLVASDDWRNHGEGEYYRQGYLSSEKERIVRVRTAGGRGYLTIKGESFVTSRLEYEYEIPYFEAQEILDGLCEKPLIEKKRYTIEYSGFTWVVDEFFRENLGLVVAEVELQSPQESVELPAWVGEEVTGDKKYYNSNLRLHPFSSWKS